MTDYSERLKPEPDGDFRTILAPPIVYLITAKTKDGKFGVNRVIQDEYPETLSLTLEPPAIGKIKVVEKETGNPMVNLNLTYYPQKEIDNKLPRMRRFAPPGQQWNEIRTDDNGVATLPMFIGADYKLYNHEWKINVEFTPKKPGEIIDRGTVTVVPLSMAE